MAEEIKEFAEISEERWLNYCKENKRKKWQGVDVIVILPDGTKVSGTDYWDKALKRDEIINTLETMLHEEASYVFDDNGKIKLNKRFMVLERVIGFIKNNYKDKVN